MRLLSALLLSLTCWAAEDTPDPERLAKATALMEQIGMRSQLQGQTLMGFEAGLGMSEQQRATMPASLRKAFDSGMVEVKELIRTQIDYAALVQAAAVSHAQLYTAAELDALAAFYASPVGQRMLANHEALARSSMASGQDAIIGLLPKIEQVMMKHMSAASGGLTAEETEAQRALIGTPFPGFTGKTLDGTPFDFASLSGQVVLVDFWATWCGPCRQDMPAVKALMAQHRDAGFTIVGVSLDEDAAALRTYLHEEGITWTQIYDGQGWQSAVAQEFDIRSIPATFLIGRDGRILGKNLRGEALAAAVRSAVETR